MQHYACHSFKIYTKHNILLETNNVRQNDKYNEFFLSVIIVFGIIRLENKFSLLQEKCEAKETYGLPTKI